MRRAARLRAGDDFRRVRREGRSRANGWCVVIAAPRPVDSETGSRIGIVASKRIGDAVTRNRAKRRVRERVRVRYGQLLTGWDIVIILRTPLQDIDAAALDDAIWSLFGRLNLVRSNVVTEAQCAVLPSA